MIENIGRNLELETDMGFDLVLPFNEFINGSSPWQTSFDLSEEPLNLAIGLRMVDCGNDVPNVIVTTEPAEGMTSRIWPIR
jgi:hypothetical protein